VPAAPWTGTQMSFRAYFGAGCAPELKQPVNRWSVSCSPPSTFSCASGSSLYKVPSYDNTWYNQPRAQGSTNPTGDYFASLTPTNITVVGMWDGIKFYTLNHALTEKQGSCPAQLHIHGAQMACLAGLPM